MEPILNSSSASLEDDGGLIGIDPDDTDEIKLGGPKGATFVIGVLPAGLWNDFNSRWAMSLQNANRRAIKSLADQGIDPEAKSKMLPKFEELFVASMTDTQRIKEDRETFLEALRYSIRSFKGFKSKSGKPYSYKHEKATVNGIEVQRLDTESMRLFLANTYIAELLWNHIRKLNSLGATEKKE